MEQTVLPLHNSRLVKRRPGDAGSTEGQTQRKELRGRMGPAVQQRCCFHARQVGVSMGESNNYERFFFQFKVALWDHDTIVGDQKITDRARLIQDRKGRDKVTLELGENRCDNFGFTVSRLNFFPTFETLLWSQEVSMNEGVLLPKIWMWLLRNRFPCFYRPLNMVLYCVRCVLIRLQDIGYGPWVSLLQWLVKKKTDFIKLRLCETRSLNQTKPLVSRSLNVTVISD